jgi:hypothetical protein
VVVHTCNPSTWEVEAGESQVQGQSGLPDESCLKKKEQRKEGREGGKERGGKGGRGRRKRIKKKAHVWKIASVVTVTVT